MNQLTLKIVLFFAVPFFFTGCATIMGKSSHPLSVSSNPAGATVIVLNKKNKEVSRSATPVVLKLKGGGGYLSKPYYKIKISAPGFDEYTKNIYFSMNNWYYGNLLFSGVIGMLIVDPITGAMWKTDDNSPIDVSLKRSTTTTGLTEPSLKIIDIKDIPERDRGSLVRIN